MVDIKNFINKIKEKGYWEVNIRPVKYDAKIVETRAGVEDIVRNAVISIRGWDYPHFSDNSGQPYVVDNGIQKHAEFGEHIELWRMTQSGNFYQLRGLKEDYLTDLHYDNMWANGDELRGKKILGALNTLFTICEIYEFAKRLTKEGVYKEKITIDIKLHDISERILYVDGSGRIPFHFPHSSHSDKPWKWNQEIEVSSLTEKEEEYILEAYKDLVDLFGWKNPPIDVFKDDIHKFLEGRFY